MGHIEILWSAVCSLAPYSHFGQGARSHLSMDEPKCPTPVRMRLSLTQENILIGNDGRITIDELELEPSASGSSARNAVASIGYSKIFALDLQTTN